MNVGEAFFFLGSAVHAGGANTTSSPRAVHGFFYCRSYLRPEVKLLQNPYKKISVNEIERKTSIFGGRETRFKNGPRRRKSRLAISLAIRTWDTAMKAIRLIYSGRMTQVSNRYGKYSELMIDSTTHRLLLHIAVM